MQKMKSPARDHLEPQKPNVDPPKRPKWSSRGGRNYSFAIS